MKTTGNTILVTGGGSGIGEALAHRFHDLGNTVIVAGRRRDALERAAADRPGMHAVEMDLQSDGVVAVFAERLLSAHPELNVVVNNAGVMSPEPLDRKRDLAGAEAMIATNLLGPIRVIDALIAHLVKRPDAAIVNVTSAVAFVPFAVTPTYSATKAAMHSYTMSLREMLKGRVEVVELIPPGVRTDMTLGQADPSAFMPLDEFTDEAMANLAHQPTLTEIAVGRASFLRSAERDGRFEQILAQMNGVATQVGDA